MPVMRKPERTKKRSTPIQPMLVTPKKALPATEFPEAWGVKWARRTRRMARPRRPSRTGIRSSLDSRGEWSDVSRMGGLAVALRCIAQQEVIVRASGRERGIARDCEGNDCRRFGV